LPRDEPGGKTFDSFISLGKDIGSAVGLRGKPSSTQWVRHAVETPGYALGLPTGQAAGTAQFLADVADGQEDLQGVQDWLRGDLAKGECSAVAHLVCWADQSEVTMR
jgi:hypothetical protein